jgi:hypothetical protein
MARYEVEKHPEFYKAKEHGAWLVVLIIIILIIIFLVLRKLGVW